MQEVQTKENTLYFPIKQVYFDQIIEGTKTEEFREIKEGITANRYLQKTDNASGNLMLPSMSSAGPMCSMRPLRTSS